MSLLKRRSKRTTKGVGAPQPRRYGSITRMASLRSFAGESQIFTNDDDLEEAEDVRIGSFSMKGRDSGKLRNEDRVNCATLEDEEQLRGSILTGYAGVFDGHGGAHCANYIRSRMFERFVEVFKDEDAWIKGVSLVLQVFAELEDEYSQLARELEEFSGSCATVVLVKDREVIVANIGDCRAVRYDRQGKVIGKTVDHRAALPSERRRILDCGEKVTKGRVHSLEPSRTFGDIDVKDLTKGDAIIATPDVRRLDFNDSPGEFLVVATDGLWDVVSAKASGKIAKNALGRSDLKDLTKRPKVAAMELAKYAVKKKSADDISIAVLAF